MYKSVSTSFANLKAGKKIGLGSGIILLFLLIVSIVSSLGLSNANTNFGDYRQLARETAFTGRLEANLLTARLGVKDYILHGRQGEADAVESRLAASLTLIDDAENLFTNEKELQQLRQARQDMQDYKKAFDRVVAYRSARNGEVEKMSTLGPKAEAALGSIMETAYADGDSKASYLAGQALRHLLLARLYSNRFLADNSAVAANRAIEEMSSFKKLAEQMRSELENPTRQQLAQDVADYSSAYREAFSQVSDIIVSRNQVIDEVLDKIGDDVAVRTEEIMLANKAQQDALGPQATADMSRAMWTAIAVSVVAAGLGILMAVFLGRIISRPVVQMTGAMQRLATGDLEIAIPAQGRHDEIGEMAAAAQVFKENAIEAKRLEAEAAAARKQAEEEKERARQAELDRAEQERRQEEERKQLAAQERKEMMVNLADEFEDSVGDFVKSIAESATTLSATASQLVGTAETSRKLSEEVASGSRDASNNVQTVAASAEELTSSISEISRQVHQANETSSNAVSEAEKSGRSVTELSETSRKIGDVVNIINDIAAQTNLLALNATIEAARAGAAGKGFAVVASEVKSLANQTARATEEIADQVTEMQGASDEAVSAIGIIGNVIASIQEATVNISSAIEEQSAATSEISRNVQEASTTTNDVSQKIELVSVRSGETGTAATQVQAASRELDTLASELKDKITSFVAEVRAA